MKAHYLITVCTALVVGATLIAAPVTVSGKATEKTPNAQAVPQKGTSYAPVDLKEDLADVIARMKAAKPEVMKRQMELLKERYDLANQSGQRCHDVPRETDPARDTCHPAEGNDAGKNCRP